MLRNLILSSPNLDANPIVMHDLETPAPRSQTSLSPMDMRKHSADVSWLSSENWFVHCRGTFLSGAVTFYPNRTDIVGPVNTANQILKK